MIFRCSAGFSPARVVEFVGSPGVFAPLRLCVEIHRQNFSHEHAEKSLPHFCCKVSWFRFKFVYPTVSAALVRGLDAQIVGCIRAEMPLKLQKKSKLCEPCSSGENPRFIPCLRPPP
jgi:hypothetical protein